MEILFTSTSNASVNSTPSTREKDLGWGIRNVLLKNIIARGKGTSMINGHPESFLEGVSLENIKLFLSSDPLLMARKRSRP